VSGLRVAYILGTASGGMAVHAGMLADGCRRAGLAVIAFGPASTRAAFAVGAASLTQARDEPARKDRPVPAGGTGKMDGTAGPDGTDGFSTRQRPVVADVPAQSDPAAGPSGDIEFELVDISDRPRPAHDVVTAARLRRLLSEARPDVVHAHGLRAGAFAALALLVRRRGARPVRPSGRPVRPPALVVTVHNAPPRSRLAQIVYSVLELTCARRADMVLCASADLAARMRRLGPARVAEFDVPAPAAPPPSEPEVARARADLGAAGRPVVLAAGRLAEQKGLDILLAAATAWQRREPVPLLAVAGEGPLAAELSATAARTGVDLLQLGPRADVPALLAAADVVVVPSRWEARALIVQEAMRAGRPIVASRVGGIPALTGEDAAMLVPPGDAEQLAAAVLAVLDDPELAARLAARARDRARALPSAADAVTAVLAIYADLASRAA
jgi:glycosyltransferase involved in cell wall biosynthesis